VLRARRTGNGASATWIESAVTRVFLPLRIAGLPRVIVRKLDRLRSIRRHEHQLNLPGLDPRSQLNLSGAVVDRLMDSRANFVG
jgi:hypothetical protein